MDLTGAYGLTPNIDVFADTANLTLNNGINYNYSWIMPRFEIYPGNILAIQLQYNKTDIASFSLTPQYHYFYENDALALEFNMGFSIPVNSAGDSTLYIVAAPVWKAVKGILHPFVEFTPSYSMSDGGSFKLNIHAGAWLGIPDTPHQFCLSVGINDVLADTRNYDLIFWYSLSFNLIPDNNKKEI